MECEVYVDGICLEHVSEFKYLSCILKESGKDEAECSKEGGKREGGCSLQVILGLWLMLGVCSLSMIGFCMHYRWCLFLNIW